MKNLIYLFFKILGIRVTKFKSALKNQQLIDNQKLLISKLNFILTNTKIENTKDLGLIVEHSKSQISQDIFVLDILNLKKNGYFVEIGAASGVHFSNTYLLEKLFNWEGILSEPAKVWKKSLKENRTSILDFRPVYKNSGEILEFIETDEPMYSTISNYKNSDKHSLVRKNITNIYKLETVSLNDLLKEYNSPKIIDYISIDTEGSELEILKNFDFSSYTFNCITVEHNNTVNKDSIDKLLTDKGYTKAFSDYSKYESWFINNNLKK